MQRLVRHRSSMLAVMLVVLVALSSTLMILITRGQQEEAPVKQEEVQVKQQEAPAKQEEKSQDDNQWIARIDTKGKAHFGFGILNPLEGKITFIPNSKDSKANATFTTATANSIPNDNDRNTNNFNSEDMRTGGENKKNNGKEISTNSNIFTDSRYSSTTIASCGQVITTNVTLLKDIECTGVGMIVGKDGITINLNNHRLSFANNTNTSRIPEVEEIGILVPGQKNVTIRGPGAIIGFDKAIEFAGSGRSYVSDVKLTDNNVGLSLKASDEVTIYRSFIAGNTIGIASQSSKQGLIINNQLSQNTNDGIVIMDSNHFIIGANSLIGNGDIGLFLDVSSFNNTISSNNILNHSVDVSNADGIPIHISMNKYFENKCGKALPDGIC
ncbi:MAG: right-handed parallel beta-helix repeat-containing protein [Thermoproteota archaeon]|nr:right-handed parallel beta-helix repeat-containing protein [Thermoproteota archaeon]